MDTGGDDLILGWKRPAVEPLPLAQASYSEDAALNEAVATLNSRSYKTYMARLKAFERLGRRNNSWNASLISLATATTIASIGLLVDDKMYGRGGDALLVALAVLSLVASLVVSSVNYGARSRAMEASYKRIQQLSLAAESFFISSESATRESLLDLRKEYGIAVEFSENHSDADHIRASEVKGIRVTDKSRNKILIKDTLVTFAPYVTLTIPVALLIPFIRWFINGL